MRYALYAEPVEGLQMCPYPAKGSVYCLISELKKARENGASEK